MAIVRFLSFALCHFPLLFSKDVAELNSTKVGCNCILDPLELDNKLHRRLAHKFPAILERDEESSNHLYREVAFD